MFNLIKPILTFLSTINKYYTKTLDVASDGTKGLANTSSNIIKSGIDLINNVQDGLSFLKDRINKQNNNSNKSDNSDKSDNSNKSDNSDKLIIGL